MLKRIKIGDPDVPSFSLISHLQEDGAKVTLGRAHDSTVHLQSSRCPMLISRNHAVLQRVGNELLLQDLGSTNGTFVKPLGSSREMKLAMDERYSLKEGDQVSFGGGQRVVQHTGKPDEDNPFLFRLKDRALIFSSDPASPAQEVVPPSVRTIASPDVVDLTEYESPSAAGPSGVGAPIPLQDEEDDGRPGSGHRHTPEGHLGNLRLSPRGRGALGRGAQASGRPALPFDPFLHASERKRYKRARTSAPIDLELLSSGDEDDGTEVPVVDSKPASQAEPPQAAAAAATGAGASGNFLSQLECQICKETMVAVHSMVPCGHAFCGECIGGWLQNPASKLACPTCRERATAPPVPSWTMDSMLEDACPQHLDKDDMEERKRKQESWKANQAKISDKNKALFSAGGGRGGAPLLQHLHMFQNADFRAMLADAFAIGLPQTRAAEAPRGAALPRRSARAPANITPRHAPAAAAAPAPRATRATRAAAVVRLPVPNPSPPLPPAAAGPEFSFVRTPAGGDVRCAACNFQLLNNHPAIRKQPADWAPGSSGASSASLGLYHLTCEMRARGFVQCWRANNGNLPGRHILPQLELTRLQGLLQNGGGRARASGR